MCPPQDDSHMVLHHMPKNITSGAISFRRLPLSSAFFCTCNIRQPTDEKRNLYLLFQNFMITIAWKDFSVNGKCGCEQISPASKTCCEAGEFDYFLTFMGDRKPVFLLNNFLYAFTFFDGTLITAFFPMPFTAFFPTLFSLDVFSVMEVSLLHP